jgi:hypothetical protein
MAAEPFNVTWMYDTGIGWTLQQLATTGCTYQEKMSFIILIVKSWWQSTCYVSQIAQSVSCPATGWTTGRSRFDPQQRREDFSSSLCFHTTSGVHPSSCTMGTGGPFPRVKAWPGRDTDHSPHLGLRSRISGNYISSPHQAPSWHVVGQLISRHVKPCKALTCIPTWQSKNTSCRLHIQLKKII